MNEISFYDTEHEQHYYDTPQVPKEHKAKPKKAKDAFISHTFRQLIVCAFALIAVLIVNLWHGDISQNIKSKYNDLFGQKTSVNEVLGAFDKKENSDPITPTDTITSTEVSSIATPVLKKVSDQSADPIGQNEVVNAMKLPLKGVVTSEFGYRIHPIYGEELFHNGIDIAADEGSDIKSALAGTVTEAQYSDSYGYYIKIHHTGGLETLYAHCNQLYVDTGDKVNKGEVISAVGSTGISTGPHLHFEVIVDGKNLNPRWVLEF